MPITTRNQMKKIAALKQVEPFSKPNVVEKSTTSLNIWHPADKHAFINDIKNLLSDCDAAPDKTAKVMVALQIYNKINNNLGKLLSTDSHNWYAFVVTAYNKTSEFESVLDSFKEVNPDVFKKFRETYLAVRQIISKHFINLRAFKSEIVKIADEPYATMYKNIDTCENSKSEISTRPRRNVPRVDYTGMDSIEPETECDGITDIWVDESLWYDSDYNPDDDLTDDDDDDDDFMFTNQFVTVRPHNRGAKIQPVVRGRNSRNIKQVNYCGMDMTEDDEGIVTVCQVKWSNRVPTYKWVKYPASKANELDDEDWFE